MSEFQSYGKIPRLNRECIITEKIDGTNAQVAIFEIDRARYDEATHPEFPCVGAYRPRVAQLDGKFYEMAFGSRNRWITPQDDNYGFAQWADQRTGELFKLGPGRHFGEWWGVGIQRNYGLSERRFSLFHAPKGMALPSCVGVVPVLAHGTFDSNRVDSIVMALQQDGSVAVPGFMRPEGVVVFHTASRTLYKVTLEGDEAPKSKAA